MSNQCVDVQYALVRRSVILVAILAFVLADACTGSISGAESPPLQISPTVAAPTPGNGDCPQDLTHVRTTNVSGTTHVLVPGHPDSFTWCENGKAAKSTDQAATERAQAALDALPLLAAGVLTACLDNSGPTYGVFFHYSSGDVVLVRYGLPAGGCPLVTNGRRTANMTEAVHDVIVGSVGRG